MVNLQVARVDVLRACKRGAERGRGEKRKIFCFFSINLSCPVRKEIWVASILITIIIIIILMLQHSIYFYFFRNQEKAPTPLLQDATGEPAVTHPYMSIKCLLLNTRPMGDFLAPKIRPA